MPRIELDLKHRDERVERAEDFAQTSTETFDRMEFAARAVALLRPRRTTVAICEGSRRVRIEAGRQWGGAEGARWAILRVPRDASRRAIATAVLTLSSGEARPWVLDVLLASSTDGHVAIDEELQGA